MSGFIAPLLKPLIEKLSNAILDHAYNTICVGHNVKALGKEVEKLKSKHKDVEEKIKTDELARKEATHEVKGWLHTVEELEKYAEAIESEYENRNCMFLGLCSFNCYSNYSISTRSVETKKSAVEEMQRAENFKEITKEVPPPPVQPVPTASIPASSRSQLESKLAEALDFLRNNKDGVLGIWGMGGVGKTTILEHINNALAEDPSFGFDRGVLVTASRGCTEEKIQKLIAKGLGLPEGGDHYKNIFDYLNNKSFVVLLDDLWDPLDLIKVGVPRLEVPGEFKRKLILASRNLQVCRNMDARLNMRVDCLSRDAARLLFREKVGERTVDAHPFITHLADEVADECRGLPKALICIARAMAGKSQVNLWVKAIEDLRASKVSNIQGIEDPLPLLKVSYDYLKNPVLQECLLHCALWPEDCRIPIQELMECWMGHGLLGEFDNMATAYNNGHEIIDSLRKASLLDYLEREDDISGEGTVSLHDLIRDMALWIARDCGANEKKWIVQVGSVPQDEKTWREVHKMSLRDISPASLPSHIPGAPNLTTLMSIYSDYSQMILKSFFHALKYLDLSRCKHLNIFPVEICQLDKLEFLNLSGNGIDSVPDELKNLKGLKYLLLRGNRISMIPRQSLSSLISLEVLDLSGNYDDLSWTNPSSIIDSLDCLKGHLKYLGITASSYSDLNKLAMLSIGTLHIEVTGISMASVQPLPPSPLHGWSNLERSRLVEGSRDHFTEEIVFEETRFLSLKYLDIYDYSSLKEIIWKRVVDPGHTFPKLCHVSIGKCDKLKHASWIVNLPLLERLQLWDCAALKHVVMVMDEATETMPVFRCLKVLQLSYLPELETFCNHPLTFPTLKTLHVSVCPMLKRLPFDTSASCSKLRTIQGFQSWWDDLEMDGKLRTMDGKLRTSLQPFVTY